MSLCGQQFNVRQRYVIFHLLLQNLIFKTHLFKNVNSNLSQVTPTGHCFHASNSVTKRWRLIVTTEQTVFIYCNTMLI